MTDKPFEAPNAHIRELRAEIAAVREEIDQLQRQIDELHDQHRPLFDALGKLSARLSAAKREEDLLDYDIFDAERLAADERAELRKFAKHMDRTWPKFAAAITKANR